MVTLVPARAGGLQPSKLNVDGETNADDMEKLQAWCKLSSALWHLVPFPIKLTKVIVSR